MIQHTRNQSIIILLALLITFIECQPEPVWTDNCISVNANSGTCIQCIQGFYLEYFLCLPCAPLCICSSQYNYCESCMAIPQQYSNYSLTPYLHSEQGRCYFCNQFIPNCISCSSTTVCTTCSGGFFPVIQPNNGGTTCTGQCSTSCYICRNASTCLECQPGYFLDPITKACTGQCGDNCTECLNNSTCKNCTVGYFLNTTINTCQNCNISECIRCSNASYCQDCGPGYYASNGSCISTGFSNCVTYIGGAESATGCQVCQAGYFVLYSNCFQCVGCALCSLQFLCQSPCFSNATQFNFACLVKQYLGQMRMAMIGGILVIVILLLV